MRIPLPERAWRRLNWLGIEPPKSETGVDGGVQGNVASGNFQGGNVTINYAPPPEPPRTPREYLDAMWLMMLEGERQTRLFRRLVILWLTVLSIGVVVSLLLNGLWMVQWQSRFGWFW